MSEQETAVVVKDLYKTFKLPHDQHSGIKQLLVNFGKRDKGYEVQQVLNGISFEIKKGEFFGIVGRNGSGKSTLLKLLAGIYAPDKGLVQVNGSLTPFIELGVGFNPELTGRENVFLNGALLGFSRSEMEAMYNDIVEFAELDKFMDQKLKNYSSGMQVRLAFSIAIRAQSDILLLDEVLAVGDEAFQRKCYSYFETLKRNKKTVILVTHDMSAIERFCTTAMFVENGDIVRIGKPSDIATAYSLSNDENYTVGKIPNGNETEEGPRETYGLSARLLDDTGTETNKFMANSRMTVALEWEKNDITDASITIVKQSGEPIFGTGTYQDGYRIKSPNSLKYELECNLQEGEYFIQIGLARENDKLPLVYIGNGPTFVISRDKNDTRWVGFSKLEHKWFQ